MLYVALIIVVVILLYIFITYNNLVKLKNRVSEAFSTMDVYLKKRWDLVPNLVETVKGYTKHESDTLKSIVELRNKSYDSMSAGDKIKANEELTSGLSSLIALKEAYPDLKANENFINLSNDLTKIEEDIANSRKYYNGCVRLYNNKVEMFPSSIVAKMLGYKTLNMFEIKEEEKQNVEVKF